MTPPIRVLLKRLPHGQDLPMPSRQTLHAAGMDLCAAIAEPMVIARGQIELVPCGFAMAIPSGYEGQVRARSGLSSKHGITLINAVGTIDADYRGEIKVPLINLGQSDYLLERGMRIAQLLILPVPMVEMVEVDQLDETTRGAGGFGHTG